MKTLNIKTSLPTKIGLNIQKNKYKEDKIGELIIKNINLKQPLYKENSYMNNVERNITILPGSASPEEKDSMMIIAAHSGTGHIAYFNNLDKLKINDIIELTYNKKNYIYKVKDIWSDKKTGYINVPKENNNQLILTTCHPTKENYQLIINCILKE